MRRELPPESPLQPKAAGRFRRPPAQIRRWLAVLVGIVCVPLAFVAMDVLLVPSPTLREPVHRIVVENHSYLPMTGVELRFGTSVSAAEWETLAAPPDLPDDGRWVLELPLGRSGAVALVFTQEGRRHVFPDAAYLCRDLGDVHVITVAPGPRLARKH